jgi:hypothetical protein
MARILSPAERYRRQLRGFVVLWSGLTFIMAAATFVAIYMSTGALDTGSASLRDLALPTEPPTATVAQAAAAPTLTAPTATVPATAVPTATEAMQAAAAPTLPPMTPTLLPVDDRRFHLGTQAQVSYDRMDEWMNVAANQMSMRWVKGQVRWEEIEPERDVYDWFLPDTYIPAAARQNLRVLVSVVTAPAWSREPGVDTTQHGPPQDPAEYAQFITDLLRRYPDQIHAVEVWNEMNLDREWTSTGGLSAENYVALLRAAYQAVKAVDPGIIVVTGALAPTGLSDGVRAWDDFVYMDQLIAAGMLNYADCVGAHHNGINVSPDYTWDTIPDDPTAQFRGPWNTPHHSWSFRSTLTTYADKIREAGGDQKLCVTEFGWPSAEGLDGVREGFEFALDNTLEEQRDFTVRAIEFMQESDFVQLAFLWNLNYGPQAGWAVDNDNVAYSVIGPGFQFRPVFDAVRDWNRAYEARLDAGT